MFEVETPGDVVTLADEFTSPRSLRDLLRLSRRVLERSGVNAAA